MVLGLLIERPSYGYELHARSKRRFGNLISFGTTHAYQAINTLQRHEMIEPIEPPIPEPTERGKRQFRFFYRVTADGAEAFRTWLAEPVQEDLRTAELLIRVGSAGVLGPQALRHVIEGYQAQCRRRAEELDAEGEREPSRRRALSAAIEMIATSNVSRSRRSCGGASLPFSRSQRSKIESALATRAEPVEDYATPLRIFSRRNGATVAAASGRERKKPCALWYPIACSRFSSPRVSTPSARVII